MARNALQHTAAGILDSAAREWRDENLSSAEAVQLASESYSDRVLTLAEAERVRTACLDYIARCDAGEAGGVDYDRLMAGLGEEPETTIDTITIDQIKSLRAKAAEAGDDDLVRCCDTALEGPTAFSAGICLGACVRAIREAEAQPVDDITDADIRDAVGSYDLLSRYSDQHGREIVCVEYADARRGYLRRELDGSLSGPLREDQIDEDESEDESIDGDKPADWSDEA